MKINSNFLNDNRLNIISLLLTPFQKNGEIDEIAYIDYLKWQITFKPQALFCVCGSSEMKWLNYKERLKLIKTTVTYSKKIPVIATSNLEQNIDLNIDEVRAISDLGVSAIVLVPPNNIKINSTKHYEYLKIIKNNSSVPLILYEWPFIENHLINANFYKMLIDNNVIIGIKDTSCTIEGIMSKYNVSKKSLIFQANTPYLLESLNKGITGIMTVTSTIGMPLLNSFAKSFLKMSEDLETIHRELVFLDSLLRINYPSSAKYIANLIGIKFNLYTRWPNNLSLEQKKSIDVWFNNSEFINF